MNTAEKKDSVCEKKAFGVVFALKIFRIYLLGAGPFQLITDYQVLSYAFKRNDVHARPAPWLYRFAEYDFDIVYRPGAANFAAEYLSSYDEDETETKRGVKVLNVQDLVSSGNSSRNTRLLPTTLLAYLLKSWMGSLHLR